MNTLTISGKKERVNFLVPQDLVKRAEKIAKDYNSSLSEIFRKSLESLIDQHERSKIENEIEEACKLYYDADKQLAADWEVAEAKA